VALGTRRILADQVRCELTDRGLDSVDGAVQRAFAPAAQSLVGVDANEQPVAPVDPVLERFDSRDAHGGWNA